MQTISLEHRQWNIDENQRLGPPGGFGEVFKGNGPNGEVAIKRLLISAGAAAHREMNIGRSLMDKRFDHVVPILDYGQDANGDRYYLVMPICEESLQGKIDRIGPLPWQEAKQIALEIAAGLAEVSELVHRDLKPGNVLFRDGRWQIADFGIAKFVEDATSLQSLRSALTPAYAAPEQWRLERSTHATDVYALGCMIYTMLQGRPPFSGSQDDVREAHLHQHPPAIPGVEPRLSSFLNSMLRKSPESRPSLERCRTVLATITGSDVSAGRAALAAASDLVSRQAAEAEAARLLLANQERQRQEQIAEASQELTGIKSRLFDAIAEASEESRRERDVISLGNAHLMFSNPSRTVFKDEFGAGWNVLASARIAVRALITRVSYSDPASYTFSAILVFASTRNDSNFRWRELSFFNILRGQMSEEPTALPPDHREFAIALSNTVGSYQLAHGPLTIDSEDEDNFHERWLRLFAKAAQNKLRPPNSLPLSANFFS
jgi:eukaryotic-like serine/threonine-protein kinase